MLATSPATARRCWTWRNDRQPAAWPPGDPLGKVLEQLPDRLIFLGVHDLRQSMFPEILVSLPNMMEYAINQTQHGLSIFPRCKCRCRPTRSLAPIRDAPRENWRWIRVDPVTESLRPLLFPSVYALAVEEQGFRLISREAFPSFNPLTLAPAALAMIVPAIGLSAQRGRSIDNLKQIGLAMHNCLAATNRFPADVLSKTAAPAELAVRILPQLGHQALYNEFHLDEPWDSPHNKTLLERMPEVFDASSAWVEPGMTHDRGFSGEHAFFDPKVPEGVGIQSITDGTSNTIGVVEAREAVPWTKPETDIPFGGDQAKLESIQALGGELGGEVPGGFHALFLDGSVRFIRDGVNLIVLWALITRTAARSSRRTRSEHLPGMARGPGSILRRGVPGLRK